ncbi:hypothetical protein QR77_17080 [Streptomyces sp. 150FB]|uniref:hypothetical protein n=1 Tax=Streptomyces sp. 150FB TaxID=1576605 RepID=UPI000588F45D|nr:hypothetical protein [Streptomyces sp. 150FB]KIF75177.1 hypothetical protein QR77_17080 [Streptomyces sp. 150FB]
MNETNVSAGDGSPAHPTGRVEATHTRRSVAGDGTHWGPVWDVMRTLGTLHGAEHVRLVVWFD